MKNNDIKKYGEIRAELQETKARWDDLKARGGKPDSKIIDALELNWAFAAAANNPASRAQEWMKCKASIVHQGFEVVAAIEVMAKLYADRIEFLRLRVNPDRWTEKLIQADMEIHRARLVRWRDIARALQYLDTSSDAADVTRLAATIERIGRHKDKIATFFHPESRYESPYAMNSNYPGESATTANLRDITARQMAAALHAADMLSRYCRLCLRGIVMISHTGQSPGAATDKLLKKLTDAGTVAYAHAYGSSEEFMAYRRDHFTMNDTKAPFFAKKFG